jgi:ribose 5-phosphate isomerase B
MKKKARIFIGADHRGFAAKEKIKDYILSKGYNVEDCGAFTPDVTDDYPDYAFRVAEKVAKNQGSFGILICGSGIGVCIAANKVKGIRAANVNDSFSAKISKEHNDANVLCLGSWKTSVEKLKALVGLWLKTEFGGAARHIRRIEKIKSHERKK